MNERDSEALACLLEERGYVASPAEEQADVLIFNTCSVRDQAERKAIGKVQIMKRLKRRRPEIVIGIIGCMAQNYRDELFAKIPHLDFVVGTDRLHELPRVIDEVLAQRHHVSATETGDEVLGRLYGHRRGGMSAFVAVMRGCNQFCSYCIVPHVRGREKSRAVDEIVSEVEGLASSGVREIVLLGQNITAYGLAEARRAGTYSPDLSPFADLLRAVNNVPGVARIRFTSPHPRDMNDAFIDAVTTLPRVCESFHVPVQSGANRILSLMKRGYTAEDYMGRIDDIRRGLPDATFSTDIIVGYPSETEEEFNATRRLMNDVGFDMAYIFKYSPREGTLAASMPDDVPQAVKEERNQLLLKDLAARAANSNKAYLRQSVEVLVEGPSKRNAARWSGRSRTNKTCIFNPVGGVSPGDLARVRITRTTPNSLFGKVEP